CERSDGKRPHDRLRAAGYDHGCNIIADVAKRVAYGSRAAGATVGVCRADTSKPELDRNVRMCRAAENLDSQHRIHPAHAFFQVTDMLIFRLADAAERRAKADTDAMLWMFARIVNPGIVKSELRRGHRELRVTIKPLETLRRE